MSKNYINIYNNLVRLTRNKILYRTLKNNDTFSDRLIILLIHFAFFLKVYKEEVIQICPNKSSISINIECKSVFIKK